MREVWSIACGSYVRPARVCTTLLMIAEIGYGDPNGADARVWAIHDLCRA
ncbi:MAG: hypothetical protein IID36_03835 [Planctomycetes bacterium]|nr:hypothetical protein [Planctomycetota bacterium]